ncbi:MAG: hypothetical protein WDN23_07580 [Edaphobacter sp.]
MSASKAALSSAGSRARIRETGKRERLIVSFSGGDVDVAGDGARGGVVGAPGSLLLREGGDGKEESEGQKRQTG